MRPRETFSLLVISWVLLLYTGGSAADAREFRESFDGKKNSWKAFYDSNRVKLVGHERTDVVSQSKPRSEYFRLRGLDRDATAILEFEIPSARILDELSATLRVIASRPGVTIALRVVFPNTNDPKTKKPLTRILIGDSVNESSRWEALSVQTTDKIMSRHLTLWRAQLKDVHLDERGAYVDRVYLKVTLDAGFTEIAVDDLVVSPVIDSNAVQSENIEQVSSELAKPKIEFRLDRLVVNDHPMFPIIVPHHGESVDTLKSLGANLVWISDYRDRNLIAKLNSMGMWATARPPSALTSAGKILPASQASIVPFSSKEDGILMWTLGTRVSSELRSELVDWVHQIENSDARLRRPIMADVRNSEELFSRDLDAIGISRHVLNTSIPIHQYREYLSAQGRRAEPGSFKTTWIQLEPSHAMNEARRQSPFAIGVEPEQIRLQVYSALAAGYRGIGYWKTSPIDLNKQQSRELAAAITQLNYELKLLEPFLATGKVVAHIPIGDTRSGQSTKTPWGLSFNASNTPQREREAILADYRTQLKSSQNDLHAEASVIRTAYGLLVLPVVYGTHSQYVPGQLALNDVRIVVPGVPESALAWEISTTGINSLPRSRNFKRVSGGTEIRLDRLVQTSAILISTDPNIIQQLQGKITKLREASASTCVDLASLKWERVRAIDRELSRAGVGQPDASQILASAKTKIDNARNQLEQNQHNDARVSAQTAMQLLRVLQRIHWNEAVSRLSQPNATLHTVSFNSLPAYRQLLSEIGKASGTSNTNHLRSGTFDDYDTMLAEGWHQETTTIKGIRAAPELNPSAKKGDFCLRMAAYRDVNKTSKQPTVSVAIPNEPLVRIFSPKIPVYSGQIVHVTGWIRVDQGSHHPTGGIRLYDNIAGPTSALRWQEKSDWKRFELIREVRHSQNFQVFIDLIGLGDARIDELRVVIHQPGVEQQPADLSPKLQEPKRSWPNPLELLDKLPTIPTPSIPTIPSIPGLGRSDDKPPAEKPPELLPIENE